MENSGLTAEKKEIHTPAAAPSLPPAKSGPLKYLLATVRILIFTIVISISAVFMLPADLLSYVASIQPNLLVGGALVATIILGIIFYFLMSIAEKKEGVSFDIEPIAAVFIGILVLVAVVVATILKSSSQPKSIAPVLVFTTAYTFYIYRIVKKVSQMRQENETIRQQYKELLAMDKEKSDFITVTSHQLRTPLTEVRWSLGYALQMPDMDDKVKSTLQKTLESVNRLAKIVDDILRARTFDHNDVVLKVKPVDAEQLIKEILKNLELFAEKQKTAVAFSPTEQKVMIEADPDQIKLALENIIDNAIRYSPNGKVSVYLSSGEGKATIRVEDNGVGIDTSDQNMIFTKFFRAKNALLVQPDGSGIGLYATKNIILKHKGTINFFSELNKGTKFIINMPLVKNS